MQNGPQWQAPMHRHEGPAHRPNLPDNLPKAFHIIKAQLTHIAAG